MANNKIVVIDATTGETVERAMTVEELAAYDVLIADAKAESDEKTAKREAALAKLAALGLEPDDLTALGL
jgi:phage FluMu protein gp41